MSPLTLQSLRDAMSTFFGKLGPSTNNPKGIMANGEAIEMLVRDLMVTDVFTVERNEALLHVDRVMSLGRVRHVLVLDEEGRLAGVMSQRDLFHSGLLKAMGYGTHALHKTLDSLLVKEVMTTNPITVEPTTSLKAAAGLMLTKKIGCLPVLEGQKLVGILTEADFVKLHAT